MSDQLQPQSGSHGTPPPAAIVDGAAKPLPRRSPTPNERARTDAPPPSNEAPGLHEEAVRGTQDAPGAAAGGDQDQEGGEPPADATTDASAAAVDPIPGFPADLVPVVGPELEDSAPAAAPAAPIAALPVVGPAKSGGVASHACRTGRARGPWETGRNRRKEKDQDQPSWVISPMKCPFIQCSAKYTFAFGPDPCRNLILAVFEFWANKRQKEDGVVLVDASYASTSLGLFANFSRDEIIKAMDSLHDDGLITRPDHGQQVIRQKDGSDLQKRRSTGSRDVLTFHVDVINERIKGATAGTDGYDYGDWMDLILKKFPREYHYAANHTGPYNQCTTCTGWRMNDGADPTINQGTPYAGSPDNQGTAYPGTVGSNQGTEYPGGRAPDGLVKAQTRVPGALHKRSKEGKKEETNTTSSTLPSSSKTENPRTVTEPPVQAGAPTHTPHGAVPLPPPAKEPENELQEGLREVGEQGRAYHPVFVAIMEKFPGLYDPEHDRAAIEAVCDDPTFAANCDTIIGKSRYLPYGGAMWPFKPTKGAPNWRKIYQGKYDQMVKEKGWVEPKSAAPVQSLVQDVTVKVGKTPAQRFDSDRMHVESRARQYRLPERFPAVWEEWRRRFKRWCADKDNPNFDDIRWLEEQIEPLFAEQQVMKRMPDELRDERYRGWGEAELMAAFSEVLGRTEAI